MDAEELTRRLMPLPVGEVRYYDSVGSTNEMAQRWVEEGAPDAGLIVADEQTAGRGRFKRRWVTRPGAALAFSLITKPSLQESQAFPCLAAWGAISVVQAIEQQLGLQAEIKWPNDVLVRSKKVCGILVEPTWQGDCLQAVVTGIGINVQPAAIPRTGQLNFPATSLEGELGNPVERWNLLRAILEAMFAWRERFASAAFYQEWERLLAFKREWVTLSSGYAGQAEVIGQVLGIGEDGSLRLRDRDGREVMASIGELHLRPASSHPR